MEKHYCDRCERELTGDSIGRIRVEVWLRHPHLPDEDDMLLEYCRDCWPNVKIELLKKQKGE
jgi:hypothetical protein